MRTADIGRTGDAFGNMHGMRRHAKQQLWLNRIAIEINLSGSVLVFLGLSLPRFLHRASFRNGLPFFPIFDCIEEHKATTASR